MTAEGSYYKYALFASAGNPNPGDPRMTSYLAGPVLHADIYGKFSGFIHGLLGVEHSGGKVRFRTLLLQGDSAAAWNTS